VNVYLMQALLAPLPQMRAEPPPPPLPAPPVEWPLVWKEAQRLVSTLKPATLPPEQQHNQDGSAKAAVASSSSSHAPQQKDVAGDRDHPGQGGEQESTVKVGCSQVTPLLIIISLILGI
jgi:hypothetical protein